MSMQSVMRRIERSALQNRRALWWWQRHRIRFLSGVIGGKITV